MSANEKASEKTVPVYTRLPVDLAARLEREAAAADRTMAGQVRHVIKAHLGGQVQGVSGAS